MDGGRLVHARECQPQAEQPIAQVIRLTIPGIPRTKKNSQRVVPRGGRHIPLPSKAWEEWAADAVPKLQFWAQQMRLAPLARPLNCAALFYRDANRGDAAGFYQGLADILEKAGIVANDKWIVSWDESRLCKDASRPRVELVLTHAETEE